MCLSAMAFPCKNPVTAVWRDGKIGTWFFVEQVPAACASKNCPAGMLETKTVNVKKETSKTMYIANLLPAIMEKWPEREEWVVRIQLDNAPAHPKPGKLGRRLTDHLARLAVVGWDIDFVAQPPNLPDTNTLDLAFFQAIQSLQYQKDLSQLTLKLRHI
jgi:hypothetical protein